LISRSDRRQLILLSPNLSKSFQMYFSQFLSFLPLFMLSADNLDIIASKIIVFKVCSATSHFDYYLTKASAFFWKTFELVF